MSLTIGKIYTVGERLIVLLTSPEERRGHGDGKEYNRW